MQTYSRRLSYFSLPEADFSTDRASAPLVGFLVAAALSTPLWVTVAALSWAILN